MPAVLQTETIPCMVQIRRNSDQEVRTYQTEWYRDGGDYIWADGNYSCDCNRYLFFKRAADEDEGALIDDRCGDGAYSVRITDHAGELLYEDGGW